MQHSLKLTVPLLILSMHKETNMNHLHGYTLYCLQGFRDELVDGNLDTSPASTGKSPRRVTSGRL